MADATTDDSRALDLGQRGVEAIKSTGTVDGGTTLLMDSSVVIFGDLYKKHASELEALPPEKRLEELHALATKSVDLSPAKSMSSNSELVKREVDTLVERSAELDKSAPAQDGAGKPISHLELWAKDVVTATKDVDFAKVYNEQGDMSPLVAGAYLKSFGQEKFNAIKHEINESAVKNITPDLASKTLEQDLVANLRADDAKGDDEKKFKNVKGEEPKELGGGLMQIIMSFIGMLLGIDLGGLMGGGKDNGQAQTAAHDAGIAVISPELEAKLDKLIPAAKDLSEGKVKAEDLAAVAEFTGKNAKDMPANMTPDEAKNLGNQINNNIADIRNTAKTEEQGKQDISNSVDTIKGAHKEASILQSPATEMLANIAMPGSGPVFGMARSMGDILDFAKKMPQLAADGLMAQGAPGGHNDIAVPSSIPNQADQGKGKA